MSKLVPRLSLVALVLACACTKQQAKTAVDVANATCVILRGLLPNTGEVQEICATAEELSPLVKHIIEMRAYKRAHPDLAGLGEMDACAVPKER